MNLPEKAGTRSQQETATSSQKPRSPSIIDGPHITDAGLQHLSRLSSLRRLRLADAQVTDTGMAHLEALTGLVELDLSGTAVSDEGLSRLKGLTALRSLWLVRTRVSQTARFALRNVLGNLTIIG
jgi:hypothetical protein